MAAYFFENSKECSVTLQYGASDKTFAKIARIHGEYHNVGDEDKFIMSHLAKFLEGKGFTVELKPSKLQDNFGMFYANRHF